LPGIDVKDLDISIEERPSLHRNLLTIKAERKREVTREEPATTTEPAKATARALIEGEGKKQIEGTVPDSPSCSAVDGEDKTKTTFCSLSSSATGETSAMNDSKTREERRESRQWIRRERTYGKVERSFVLPQIVDVERVKSKYSNGVLSISFPKLPPKPSQSSKRSISIETL
jgi:HSP20 family molecular chaperone IbpA